MTNAATSSRYRPAGPPSTDITYDAHGRLSGIRDYRGGLTRFARDAFGRVVAVEDPLGGVTRFAYEPGTAGFWQPSRVMRPDGW